MRHKQPTEMNGQRFDRCKDSHTHARDEQTMSILHCLWWMLEGKVYEEDWHVYPNKNQTVTWHLTTDATKVEYGPAWLH